MTSRRALDFVVIGAAKADATSLFRYLQPHPRIYRPTSKEAPFFCIDERWQRGWDAYVDEFFRGAPPDRLWGTVTPHYMQDPRVPARMASLMPRVRLAALLQHPVDQVRSHHAYNRRRDVDRRSLDKAILEDLEPASLERARRATWRQSTRSYVAKGEYARILRSFLDHFPLEALQVYFTDELAADPVTVLDAVLTHLGLEPGFRPPHLGERFNPGGSRQRFGWLVSARRNSRLLTALWRALPRRWRGRLWMSVHVGRGASRGRLEELAPELHTRLVEHYRQDVAALEALLGRPVPWEDRR